MVKDWNPTMTNAYRVVQWNTHKKIYDLTLAAIIAGYLITFVGLGIILFPSPEEISLPILMIRALGTCAILLLHFILAIGPLARITPRLNPILYNRRHLGVAFFTIAATHAILVFAYYGGFGVENPISAVLVGAHRGGGTPYEFYGFLALLIFALMAATSHDFWLANLGASFWKFIHMGVYLAYALVIAHVVFGVLESEKNILYPALITLGAATIASLHLFAGVREVQCDHQMILSDPQSGDQPEWVDVCSVDEIQPDRAKIIQINTDERIAVYRHNNAVSAISNVCAHQGGPLGEGKIVDGCVTCPWHGYQYRPACGQSPPPFTEKIPTFDIRIEGRRVLINPTPNAPGTPVEPATYEDWGDEPSETKDA
jgi:nitrite reductase/ring-hydroxylating ferredoxin subunit/DMSO/TMAO reductase YedYZ heme-binding membrane subunit